MSLVEKALKKIQGSQKPSLGALRTAQPVSKDEELVPLGAVTEASRIAVADEHRRSSRPFLGHGVAPSAKLLIVNRATIRAAGLLPPEHQERQIADQYRQIKRPLVAMALKKGPDAVPNAHLIMVSSATPGDGKTFTSVNLAMSMSLEKDINILLIDGDVAKPHISRLFGVENEPGLLDALHDEALDLESLILPTDVPGLSVLPAGRRSENATELLASQRMEQIASELENHDTSRIAIIDSPPLLLTNESRVLAQTVGQIVLVVRAGKTSRQDLLDAISHIEAGKSIGLVLNQSMSALPGYYYGDAEKMSIPK